MKTLVIIIAAVAFVAYATIIVITDQRWAKKQVHIVNRNR